MSLRERFAKLDALQRGRMFKLVASGIVVLAAIAIYVGYVVARHAPGGEHAPAPAGASAGATLPAEAPEEVRRAAAAEKSALEATQRIIDSIAKGREDSTSLAVGLTIASLLALTVIWLGLGLTFLGLLVLGLAPALVMGLVLRWTHAGWILGGLVTLTAAFAALLRLLKVAFSLPHPVLAIARNVLDEAVRMKISLVFIVILILGLALLPSMLDASQPLRYRVQSFLQYATGGFFWITAVLIVLFSVATVTFEQRDKVIWQTMTKPVKAWEYVLGKWVGVVSLAAALLATCGAGTFLFTEHLRSQPAVGERADAAFVTDEPGAISEDRFVLETQVLVARETRRIKPREFDRAQLEKTATEEIRKALREEMALYSNLSGAEREAELTRRVDEMMRAGLDSLQKGYRSIGPGATSETYVFEGLEAARRADRPLILRYKIDAGSNAPEDVYTLTFAFSGGYATSARINLGQFQKLELLPAVVQDDGTVQLRILNGRVEGTSIIPNANTVTFPPDGLELSFAVSSYRPNFARVVFVLWVKLAFLAMLGIAGGTFLSFPVASMVAFGAFFAAESSMYLTRALDNFATADREGKILILNTIIANIAGVVAGVFRTYGQLNPTKRLVEGVLLSWGDVAQGTAVLGLWTLIFFAIGAYIFRRRELAMYSGH